MTEAGRIPAGLTLLQLTKFIVFWAAAFACIAPAVRDWEMGTIGTVGFLILEGIAVPLVLTSLGLILIRPGAWKERFIIASLLVSVVVALGFDVWILSRMIQSFAPGGLARFRTEGRWLGMAVLVTLFLGFAFTFLFRRLIRSCAGPGPSPGRSIPSPPDLQS